MLDYPHQALLRQGLTCCTHRWRCLSWKPLNQGSVMMRGFDPWVRKIPWRRKWQLTAVFLPGKSHGQRSLAAAVHKIQLSEWAHTLWPCSLHRAATTHVPAMARTPCWEEEAIFTWHALPRSFRIRASAITETTEPPAHSKPQKTSLTELPLLRCLQS